MPALLINESEIPVRRDGATEEAPEIIGSASRSASGQLRGALRTTEKRRWSFATPELPEVEAAATEAALGDTLIGTAAGDLIAGTGSVVTVLVEVAGYTHIQLPGGEIRRGIRFTLTEV